MSIKLTNPDRKSTPQPKPEQFYTVTNETGKKIVKAKFSKVFQDAGHTFTKSYEVIRLSYWLKYQLIGHFECALYDTLHLFAKHQIEFTLDMLADNLGVNRPNKNGVMEISGVGDFTLRQALDNLENAELIEIIKVRDELGERNDYIIKSPYYERSTFGESKEASILRAKEELPEVFLESQIERLSRQIKKNSVKRLRSMQRHKKLSGIRAAVVLKAQKLQEERRFLWKRLVKTFGVNAVKFDQTVYEVIQYEFLQQLHGREYQANFVRVLKKRLEESKIGWTHWFEGIADDLRVFYESRLRTTAPVKTTKANNGKAAVVVERDKHEAKEFLLDTLQKRNEERQQYTFNDLVSIFRKVLKHLKFDELQELAEPYFADESWQKITNELRL